MKNLGAAGVIPGAGLGQMISNSEKQEMRRHAALQLALQVREQQTGQAIVANARIFETYLSGDKPN